MGFVHLREIFSKNVETTFGFYTHNPECINDAGSKNGVVISVGQTGGNDSCD